MKSSHFAIHPCLSTVLLFCTGAAHMSESAVVDAESLPFGPVQCEGDYPGHVQGVCTNNQDVIYWSFTTVLVKTDRAGKLLRKVDVPNHHGDLCFLNDRLYVAVNLGKFNDPDGNADSWVYVYNAQSLEFISRHEAQEVFHGAGGIGVVNDRFYVVGGLPEGVQENYVYEYDRELRFLQKHVIASGWTSLGIQTATWHDDAWWFGCYGTPKILLKTDARFHMLGRYEVNASLGIIGIAPERFLVASGPRTSDKRHMASLAVFQPDPEKGLVVVSATKDGGATE
jgi:hypothetical protein